MNFYDFEPGMPALGRMFTAAAGRWIAARRQRQPYRLFTDGIGYIDQQIAADGLFEKGLVELMLDMARRHGKSALYIDIGANIGNHLVAAAPHFEKAVGFDPHPVLFHVLTANVMANQLRNVELHNVGLAAADSEATLIESAANHGLSRVKEHSRLSADTFGLKEDQFGLEHKIRLVDACEFLGRYGSMLDAALIKIDVEGMEFEILKAIRPLLERHRPVVAFEWFHHEQPEIAPLLAELTGYQAHGAFIRQPANAVARLAKNLFRGRRYELEDIAAAHTPRYYPLVFLVPR